MGLGTPSSGGRILLVRRSPETGRPTSESDSGPDSTEMPPVYDVELRASGVVWRSRASLTEPDGQARFGEWSRVVEAPGPSPGTSDGREAAGAAPDEPPSWLRVGAAALLRTVARQAARTGRWPRRIHRWRRARDDDDGAP